MKRNAATWKQKLREAESRIILGLTNRQSLGIRCEGTCRPGCREQPLAQRTSCFRNRHESDNTSSAGAFKNLESLELLSSAEVNENTRLGMKPVERRSCLRGSVSH